MINGFGRPRFLNRHWSLDRKSTRLNSSHPSTSYAVFCLKKKNKIPDCRVEVFTVVTNKCPWNGYRAFGKEAVSFLMDRVIFFFNDTATTEIYTLSLHDALPI